jgi:hypothetical protein
MKMTKKIILGLVAGVALSLTAAVGCDSNNGGTGNGGGGGTGGGGGSTGGDMSFVCVPNPTSGTDFLNGCPEATVSKVEITPEFPTLAPGGKLPALQ